MPRFLFVTLPCALLLCGCSTTVTSMAVQDALLATRVKTALVNDAQVGTRPIEVHATGVRLVGRVDSDAQAARAIELARAVEGVADVVSELRVAVPPEPAAASPPESERSRARPSVETDDQNDSGPNLLAVGISVRRSMPADGTLDDALRLGPLIRLGSGRGWGPAIGFGWYGAEWYEGGPGRVPLGRLHRLAGMATVASLT